MEVLVGRSIYTRAADATTKVSINKLIDAIMEASQEVFKGTVYKDNWKVYHHELTLMTDKQGLDYTKEKDFFKQMFLPQNKLKKGTLRQLKPLSNQP